MLVMKFPKAFQEKHLLRGFSIADAMTLVQRRSAKTVPLQNT